MSTNTALFLEVVVFLFAMTCALGLYGLLRLVVTRTVVAARKNLGALHPRL